MGRKPSDDPKININLRIKKSLVDKIRQIPNFTPLVESLIEAYFVEKDKKVK